MSLTKKENEFAFVVRAMRYRNYRLFFGGQGVSLVGTWMQSVAISWLVYRMTNSALMLGVVGFATQIPAFFLTPLAGVLIDRWNRYRILVVVQALEALQALVLAVLFFSGHITVWQIVVLSTFLGLASAFEMPARHAFIFELIEKKEDLSNAIALNSIMFNSARLIGPLFAGILIASVGEGMCFFLNGISYLAVIAAFLMMKVDVKNSERKTAHVLKELKDGLAYAFSITPIRYILVLVAIASLVGVPYAVLLPVVASQVFHGGAQVFGFLVAATGVGAFLGAVHLAARKTVVGLAGTIAMAAALFGVGLILFSFSSVLWISLILMVFVGYAMIIHMASANTILQTIVDDDKRGRVMSLYVMAFIGMMPVGSLLAGVLANRIGAPRTITISGITCLAAAAFFASKLPVLRAAIRPIYRKKGIIREEVAEIPTMAEEL